MNEFSGLLQKSSWDDQVLDLAPGWKRRVLLHDNLQRVPPVPRRESGACLGLESLGENYAECDFC